MSTYSRQQSRKEYFGSVKCTLTFENMTPIQNFLHCFLSQVNTSEPRPFIHTDPLSTLLHSAPSCFKDIFKVFLRKDQETIISVSSSLNCIWWFLFQACQVWSFGTQGNEMNCLRQQLGDKPGAGPRHPTMIERESMKACHQSSLH